MNQSQVALALKTGLALVSSDDVKVPTSHIDGVAALRQFLQMIATGKIALNIVPDKVPAPPPAVVPEVVAETPAS
jgi:hypothetical protein